MSMIPKDDLQRKNSPMYRGLLGYFPAALFEVAAHSLASDLKHGAPPEGAPHWMRGASTDHEDCILRHLIDAGPRREPRLPGGEEPGAVDARRYHLRCIAWRALALLQEDCEADGATPGVSSVFSPAADDGKGDRAQRMSADELAAAEEDFAVEMYNEAYLPARPAKTPDVFDRAEQKASEVQGRMALGGSDRFAGLKGGQ